MKRISLAVLVILCGCEEISTKSDEPANWTCDLTITGTDTETGVDEILQESSYEAYCTTEADNDDMMQENCSISVGNYESDYQNVTCDWNCLNNSPCEIEDTAY